MKKKKFIQSLGNIEKILNHFGYFVVIKLEIFKNIV